MGLTEAEAKTKWCPFGRQVLRGDRGIAYQGAPAGNRNSDDSARTNCIGSACMAWRFVFIDKSTSRRTKGGVKGRVDLDYTRGHCGLAGKP